MGRRLKATPNANATRHKTAEVEVRNVAHPKVWATAIKVAGGDSKLIAVDGYSKVTVNLN